jgi:hypothetical protein
MLTPFSGPGADDAFGYGVCASLAIVTGVIAAILWLAGLGIGGPLIGAAALLGGSVLFARADPPTFRLLTAFSTAFALLTWPVVWLAAAALWGGFE